MPLYPPTPALARTHPGALSPQDANAGGVEEMLEVLGGLGVLHQLPLSKGGHWVTAGPAPLPGGIGDVEGEESRPVESHLVEAVGRAIGEEAAAQVAAQALGVYGGQREGSARSHPL